MVAPPPSSTTHGHPLLVDGPLLLGSWFVLPTVECCCRFRLHKEAAIGLFEASWNAEVQVVDPAAEGNGHTFEAGFCAVVCAAWSYLLALRFLHCRDGLLQVQSRAGKLFLCASLIVHRSWTILFPCTVEWFRQDALWRCASELRERRSCKVTEILLLRNKENCMLIKTAAYLVLVVTIISVLVLYAFVDQFAVKASTFQTFVAGSVDLQVTGSSCALEGWHATPSLGFIAFAGVRAEKSNPELLRSCALTVAD